MHPNEKRYFRRFCGIHGGMGSKHHEQLFQLIDKIEVLDSNSEANFKREIRKRQIAKNLPAAKKRLYQLILKVLRNYHQGKGLHILINEYMIDYEVLSKKGLLRQAFEALTRAEKIADDHFLLPELVRILKIKEVILNNYIENLPLNKEKAVAAIRQKSRTAIAQYIVESKLNDLYSRYKKAHRHGSNYEEVLNECFEALQSMNLIESDLSLRAALMYYQLVAEYHTVKEHRQEAKETYLKIINLFHNQAIQKTVFREQYANALYNYSVRCILASDYKEADGMMKELLLLCDPQTSLSGSRASSKDNFKLWLQIKRNFISAEILYHVHQFDFGPIVYEKAAGYEEFLFHPEDHYLHYHWTINNLHNLILAFFLEASLLHARGKETKKLLQRCNHYIAESKKLDNTIRQDLHFQILCYEIVIGKDHLDEPPFFISNIIKNAKRLKGIDAQQKQILGLLNKWVNAKPSKVQSILADLREYLIGIDRFKEIQCWLSIKIDGKLP